MLKLAYDVCQNPKMAAVAIFEKDRSIVVMIINLFIQKAQYIVI